MSERESDGNHQVEIYILSYLPFKLKWFFSIFIFRIKIMIQVKKNSMYIHSLKFKTKFI